MAHFILTSYIEQALSQAVYEKLEDNTLAGRIPLCTGVIAFGQSSNECKDNLQSTLEEWIWLGLKLGQPLPILGDFDLNATPALRSIRSWG